MPRTATLTATKHDGSDVLVMGHSAPFMKVLAEWKQFKLLAGGEGCHKDYKQVQFQESDSHLYVVNFRTPEAQKKHLKAREAEEAAYQKKVKQAEEQTAKDAKAPRLPRPEQGEADAAEKKKREDAVKEFTALSKEALAKALGHYEKAIAADANDSDSAMAVEILKELIKAQ